MLRGAAMRRALVLVPRDRLDAVLEAVGALAVLHPVAAGELEAWPAALRSGGAEAPDGPREELLRRLEAVARGLGLPAGPAGPGPPPDLERIARWTDAWSSRLERLRAEQGRARREVQELERTLHAAQALARSGVDLERLRGVALLSVACGWIEADERLRLRESLARVLHRVVEIDAAGRQQLVLVLAPAAEGDRLERALRSVGFAALDLGALRPAHPPDGDPDPARAVASRLRRAHERRREVEADFERMRGEVAGPLARARAALERAGAIAGARRLAGRSEAVAVVGGWIPQERAEALGRAVHAATDGCCHVHLEAPEELARVREGAAPVPVLLRNPAPLRPFERLITGYGVPRWRELDPTSVVAACFWAMFGLMFGDVGHGAVLTAAGAWIARRRPRHRDYGTVLVQCGLASIAFGFAYGSVFGYEDWLPALWLRPMDDPAGLMRTGAGLGLALLSLALGLGVLNAALRRDWDAVLLGSHGVLVAVAYWTVAAAGLRWLAGGEPSLGAGIAAAGVAAPLGLWWLGNVAGEHAWRGAPGMRASLPGAAFQSTVELVDLVVRGIANTVSFVRLAAFAVAHAGLLLAVFAISEAISGPGGMSAVAGALVMVLGNLLVLCLEGLIVSIQAVRLIYYELFSRFHQGSGVPFRPLDLRVEAGAEGVP